MQVRQISLICTYLSENCFMKIKTCGYTMPINKTLINILEKELGQLQSFQGDFYILNFRDPDYSSETGGFHPVEIMLNEKGIIQYITDFAYVGQGNMSELAKEIDFDFSSGLLEHFGRCYPIEQGVELFELWQQNFCAYYYMKIFQVSVSSE